MTPRGTGASQQAQQEGESTCMYRSMNKVKGNDSRSHQSMMRPRSRARYVILSTGHDPLARWRSFKVVDSWARGPSLGHQHYV